MFSLFFLSLSHIVFRPGSLISTERNRSHGNFVFFFRFHTSAPFSLASFCRCSKARGKRSWMSRRHLPGEKEEPFTEFEFGGLGVGNVLACSRFLP